MLKSWWSRSRLNWISKRHLRKSLEDRSNFHANGGSSILLSRSPASIVFQSLYYPKNQSPKKQTLLHNFSKLITKKKHPQTHPKPFDPHPSNLPGKKKRPHVQSCTRKLTAPAPIDTCYTRYLSGIYPQPLLAPRALPSSSPHPESILDSRLAEEGPANVGRAGLM